MPHHEKIAPDLTLALEDYQKLGRQGLDQHKSSLGLVSVVDSPKPSRSVIFLYCDEDAGFEHLEPYGVRVNQPQGQVRTGITPIESIPRLAEEQSVERIIPAHYLHMVMDVASLKTHLPGFRQGHGLSGSGVIVGVVDSGIDPNHPAFQGRIQRIWDQTLNGPGVTEGGYGVELSGEMLTVSRDSEGHGTHVSGIAAGAGEPYGGVAPGADLLVVKTDLQDAHVADGVRYVFRVAQELGRPAVVNLSLGGHNDPHDGSDPLSMIIDSEVGPGRILCAAAGNDGNNDIHANTQVPQGRHRLIRFHVPTPTGAGAVTSVMLNGWYSGDDQIEVAIQTPGGFETDYQGPITEGSPSRTYDLPDGRVRVVTPGPDPMNGDHNFLIELFHPHNTQLPLTANIWQLKLRGGSITNGVVDVWITDSSPAINVFFTGVGKQDAKKIGSPGACQSAVTVASYNTRVTWTDIDGSARQVGLDLNNISDFSSEGPLRNEVLKPDLSAPGAMIIAPLSSDMIVARSLMVTPGYRVDAGTSMATPFICGLTALLLESDPSLDPDGIKALLRANAAIPNKEPGVFHPKWGYGLIDCGGLLTPNCDEV